ncbi:MAG: FAD-binding protein, partial [Deltaproteobacteria bacterium]|nr:FAD-binding protein [Deltaproteobacteria bacterium]
MQPLARDALALGRELAEVVRGEVRFDDGARGLYATDASNYRQVPIGVVVPRDADDVVAAIAACRRHGAPVLARGGGTSLAGQCCNVAVVLDFSKYMRRIVSVDPANRRAIIEPGVVLDQLRRKAERHHLTFAPDPSTHDHCTLGGMIGNDACGVHSVMGGKTDDNVEELEVVTYDGLRLRVGGTSEEKLAEILRQGGRRGQIYLRLKELRDRYAEEIRSRYPRIPRRVSGYNLDRLLPENGFDVAKALVGTEGTCVTVLEATLRLVPSPPARSLLVLGYPTVFEAAEHVMEILGSRPTGLEGLDDTLVEDMKKLRLHPEDVELLPEGKGWLLVEYGGETREESHEKARRLMASLRGRRKAPSMRLFDDPTQERMVWKVRESGLGATAHVPGKRVAWEGWEDSAVPPEQLARYLHDLRRLLDEYQYQGALYGHFGQGCVHTRIDFELRTREGIDRFRSFVDRAADLVLKYDGSLSGEHGDGQSRAELLPKMFGEKLVRAFQEFKAIWDPRGKMNPHKVVDPYRITENLRLGTDYRPPATPTHFRFPDDAGSFAQATLRCVGVGACRRTEGGTMCPSYMVTKEEKHSTRGRARMLFEMLEGQPV